MCILSIVKGVYTLRLHIYIYSIYTLDFQDHKEMVDLVFVV